MHKTKDQLYDEIKDLKTKTEFDQEIKNRQIEYDNLLDEDALALLIVDELGRNKLNLSKIADLKPGLECTIFGRITDINTSRDFKRKNGSLGKVVNLNIADESGSCVLTLWDKDVELVKNKMIHEGTNVKVVNGYVKNGFNGIGINIGRWGILKVEPEDMPDFNNETMDNSEEIKGELVEIEPTRAFFKDTGEFGFVTNIKIKDEKDIKQLVIWGEKVKEMQHFKQGDMIVIKNFDTRQKDGKNELHVNSRSTIKKL